MRPQLRAVLLAAFILTAFAAALPPRPVANPSYAAPAPDLSAQQDPRFFPQTGFRIADDAFLTYFLARGDVATFGYPTSRSFLLLGTRVQFFQRHVLQLRPDGGVGLLNLLDADFLPYAQFGSATVPPADQQLALAAPAPATPNYGAAVLSFIEQHVPNEWQGLPVRFRDAYLAPARSAGEDEPVIQALVALELLGFPTSRPASDPSNTGFVYQRFQRGVLHYDAASGSTQPLLLADYLKGFIRGREVPPALLQQAATSRFALQYAPGQPLWLARPFELPATDLTAAFEREDQPLPAVPPPAPPTSVPLPPPAWTATPIPTPTPIPTFTPVSPQPTPTLAATSSPTVNPEPPVLQSAEPGGAAPGQDIILRGRNFGTQPGHIFFTGKLTTPVVWGETNVVVTVPQGAVDGIIRVRRADGVFSNSIGFAPHLTPSPETSTPTVQVTPSNTPTPGPPLITQLSPYYGPPGSSLIIRGSAFGSATGQVLMGSSYAPVEANGWSDVSIAVRVPTDLGTGAVRVFVRRPDGQLNAAPACYQVQPASTATPTPGGTATPSPTAGAASPTPTQPTSC